MDLYWPSTVQTLRQFRKSQSFTPYFFTDPPLKFNMKQKGAQKPYLLHRFSSSWFLFLSELSNQKTTSNRQECRISQLQQISLQATTLVPAATSSQLAVSDSESRRRNWKTQTHEPFQSAVQMNRVHLSAAEVQIQTGIRPQANRSLTDSTYPLANICQHHKTITLVCTTFSSEDRSEWHKLF